MTKKEHASIFREIASLIGHEFSQELLDSQWNLIKDIASGVEVEGFPSNILSIFRINSFSPCRTN